MPRFVVRFRGKGLPPADALQRLATLRSARVLQNAGRTFLVEGNEPDLRQLFADPEIWHVAPEVEIPRPDLRPRVTRPPRDEGEVRES